jgi:hypothetical protein
VPIFVAGRVSFDALVAFVESKSGVGEGNVHMMGDGRAYRDVLSTRGMERRKSRVTFASVVGSGNWGASLFGKSAV